MQRSFVWGAIAIVAILLAPFAGVLGAPASIVRADVASPAAVAPDDEIIVITATGQLRVDDFFTPAGYKPVSWNSGSETGFTTVAGGDFNGDGDAELVASRGSLIRVFDPVVQPGRAPVDFTVDLGSQRNVRLLTTGDFDADTRDEFAVINYVPGSTIQAALQVYDGGTNATASEWTLRNTPVQNYAEYGAMFQDMSVGDFNNDGADDLVMIRNVGDQRLVQAWNVRTWASIASGSNYCCEWLAVAGGKISLGTPGDQIALIRDGYNAATNGLILFKVVSGAFEPLVSDPAWRWYPDFRSLSLGDLNGDGDDEVVQLRDPVEPRTSLLMVNPVGAAMNPFQQATGAGASAFRIVRTGDVDGDLLDEIVILRGDRYRVYTEPNVDARATETPGTYYTPGGVSNLPFLALANVDGPGQPLGPVLNVAPSSLSFSLNCGDTSPLKPLAITNTGVASSFAWQAQAIEDTGSGWLLIDSTSGTTPGTVNVSVRPGIAQGNYSGKVRITATDTAVQNRVVDVPVTYAALCSGFAVSPGTLNFNLAWGDTGAQPVTIGGPGPTAWTSASSPVPPTVSCDWLTLSSTSGTTPSSVNILANSVLAGVGTKQCLVIFATVDPSVPGSPKTVTVNLTVPDPGFVVTPSELTIRQPVDGTPLISYITIFRPGRAVQWTASALPTSAAADFAEKLASGQATITGEGVSIDGALVAPPDWLVISPTSGTTNPTTPSQMQVSVKQGTPAGRYSAVITVAASGDPSLTNPVQLVTVTAYVANFKFIRLPVVLGPSVSN
jgi:hypothetical protein